MGPGALFIIKKHLEPEKKIIELNVRCQIVVLLIIN